MSLSVRIKSRETTASVRKEKQKGSKVMSDRRSHFMQHVCLSFFGGKKIKNKNALFPELANTVRK